MQHLKPTRAQRFATVALALAGFSSPAWSANLCIDANGKKSFQDTPCAADQKQSQIKLYSGNLMEPVPTRPAEVARAIANGQVATGMTESELLQAFGQPSTVNSSLYGTSRQDQLVYRKGGDTWYVYTRDGIVTAVQHRPGTGAHGIAGSRRECPSDAAIRDMEVEASSLRYRELPQARQRLRERIGEAKACRSSQRGPSFGSM